MASNTTTRTPSSAASHHIWTERHDTRGFLTLFGKYFYAFFTPALALIREMSVMR